MQPPQQHSRINLTELKAQLVRKLGTERSKQYFDYLNKLLSLKISKAEFDKLCVRIVGRALIPLHNQFIRSIIKNACTAKVPPSAQELEATRAVGNKKTTSDGHQQNGSHPALNQSLSPLAFSNGDILPLSPRKARTGLRERRAVDRRSALGLNGKLNVAGQPSANAHSGDDNVILENGNSTPPDTRKPVQHHQERIQQAENGNEVLGHPAKFPLTDRSPGGLVSVHSNDQIKVVGREDRKEVSGRSSLNAPLGVPFCPVSIGGARSRALPLASSSKCISTFSSDAPLDTMTLRDRMEQIAATQGLQGVSMECANVLNNGLDAYLKGLIRSCVELNGARSGHGPIKNISNKYQSHLKLVNGVRPGHHYPMQTSNWPMEAMQDQKPNCPISLLDFRVAMELKPQKLGEDWPLLLEKISTHTFEE